MKIELVTFDKRFLDLSWIWLSDPEVKQLSGTPDFTKEDQEKWFKSLNDTKNYRIWGITADTVPIGATGLKRITEKSACVFWYIGDKNYWGRGIGNFIASEMSNEGRKLNLEYLYGEPNIENFRSINLLFKEGYKIVRYEKTYYVVKKLL